MLLRAEKGMDGVILGFKVDGQLWKWSEEICKEWRRILKDERAEWIKSVRKVTVSRQ